ncbi:hypothetical protein [Pararhodospirillum oryzae]|nr:hypothetical protein [Pararhodospirillum oryzae]
MRIAEAVGVSRQMVYLWRRDTRYRQGLFWLAGEKIAETLIEDQKRKDIAPTSTEQRRVNLEIYIRDHWSGPVESPLDGEVYETIEDYIGHVLDFDQENPIAPAPPPKGRR